MAIVYPSDAVARRWGDGLRARLRRAPLEAFLRARSLAPAAAGVAQDSDNLARAAVLVVEAGVSRYCEDRVAGLSFTQRTAVGYVACVVSRTLAELISQPEAWRVAALVSTARLLTPWIGLSAAAMESASTVREFQRPGTKLDAPQDLRLIEETRAAVNRDRTEAMFILSGRIARRLDSVSEDACAAEDSPWYG